MIATVLGVLLWIALALVALLLLLLALALASRIHLEASLAADPRALLEDANPVTGWARVRWLGVRGRLELPAFRLRLSFLGVPLLRRDLFPTDAAPPRRRDPKGETEAPKDESEPRRPRTRRPKIGRLRLALRALRRAVRLERLEGELVLATPDPALTGELLGWGYALGAALPRSPARRFALRPDFAGELPRGRVELALTLRVALVALAGWRGARAFGYPRLSAPRTRRRRASAPPIS